MASYNTVLLYQKEKWEEAACGRECIMQAALKARRRDEHRALFFARL